MCSLVLVANMAEMIDVIQLYVSRYEYTTPHISDIYLNHKYWHQIMFYTYHNKILIITWILIGKTATSRNLSTV